MFKFHVVGDLHFRPTLVLAKDTLELRFPLHTTRNNFQTFKKVFLLPTLFLKEVARAWQGLAGEQTRDLF
jgi:hypothetical protein